MKIALWPWEIIWLACLLVFIFSLFGTFVRQISQRRWLPNSPVFYISFLLLLIIPAALTLTGYRFSLNSAPTETTHLDHPIPDLRIHEYRGYNITQVYEASLRVVQSMQTYAQPWRITFVDVDPAKAARIEVLVPVLWYADEMSISVQPSSDRQGVGVVLFSRTASGYRDFGENARHIKSFFDALDAELAAEE